MHTGIKARLHGTKPASDVCGENSFAGLRATVGVFSQYGRA